MAKIDPFIFQSNRCHLAPKLPDQCRTMVAQSLDGDSFSDGAVLGCIVSGIVEGIGSKVSRREVKLQLWFGEVSSLSRT